MKKYISLMIGLLLAGFMTGCVAFAEEDFKNALPQEDDLRVVMGQGDTGERAGEVPRTECPDCCVDPNSPQAEGYIDSEIYKMTRSAIYHVNGGLAVICGWFAAIVQFPYSEELANGYIWGPWDDTNVDPLSRLRYRFVMTSDATDLYNFQLEAQLINDETGTWTPLVVGDVTVTGGPHRGTGNMAIDFDTLHEMDSSHPSTQHGVITYQFDVSQESPTRAAPNHITTLFDNYSDDQSDMDPVDATYEYFRYEALAGEFSFETAADIVPEEALDGLPETFTVVSKWDSAGEGIGSANVNGGSLPTQGFTSYGMTDCWASSDYLFYQTFNQVEMSMVEGEPTQVVGCGAATNCPAL